MAGNRRPVEKRRLGHSFSKLEPEGRGYGDNGEEGLAHLSGVLTGASLNASMNAPCRHVPRMHCRDCYGLLTVHFGGGSLARLLARP